MSVRLASKALQRRQSIDHTFQHFCTASNAIGEITADVLLRAFEAMSASSKNLHLACAQRAPR
jgi:hypothetical protein